MELERAREEYTVCCTRYKRSGLAWLDTGNWKKRDEERIGGRKKPSM
jgi:hypothetical protein